MASVSPLAGKAARAAATIMLEIIKDKQLTWYDVDALLLLKPNDYIHLLSAVVPLINHVYSVLRLAAAADSKGEALELLSKDPSFGALAVLITGIAAQEPVKLAITIFRQHEDIRRNRRVFLASMKSFIDALYPQLEELQTQFGPDWSTSKDQDASPKIAMFFTDLFNLIGNWELAMQLRSRVPPLGMCALYFSIVCETADDSGWNMSESGHLAVNRLIREYLAGKPTSILTPEVIVEVANKTEGPFGEVLSLAVRDCEFLVTRYIQTFGVIPEISEDLLLSAGDLMPEQSAVPVGIERQMQQLETFERIGRPIEAEDVNGMSFLVEKSILTILNTLKRYSADDAIEDKVQEIRGDSQCADVIRRYLYQVLEVNPEKVARAVVDGLEDSGIWPTLPSIPKEEILTAGVAWLVELVGALYQNQKRGFDVMLDNSNGQKPLPLYKTGVVAALILDGDTVMDIMRNTANSGRGTVTPQLVRDCIMNISGPKGRALAKLYNRTLKEIVDVGQAKKKIHGVFTLERAQTTLARLTRPPTPTFEYDHGNSDWDSDNDGYDPPSPVFGWVSDYSP